MIIDTHAHFVPAAFLEALRAERRLFPSVKVTADGPQTRMAFAGGAPTRPVAPRLSDLKLRQEWLGAHGIDCQLAGGWLDLFGYELPPEEGADWARFMNEMMLKGAAALPSLAPLATVPLQNGALAATVLEEALAAGCRGVMIGTQPHGTHGALDDRDLDPFWEAASSRKVTVFVHPMFGCGDDRLNGFDLINAVGRATDTVTAMARLLYSGHLQRFPGMNLVISHGGGGLPYLLGRLARNNAIHPGEYADAVDGFRRLYFDTVLFDPRTLRYLCDCAGADKVVLGSDHPFPIGDPAPVKVVDETPLTAAERRAILGDTAARLFHLRGG
ncbi:MAG TPA: amidohydrolase family protein [Stellaceae bacterium]|nr:amidohydrolase family protein [Stellaceae bacterium]